MKKGWKRLNNEAVSPVIAVILMVAITVVLAAVLYVTVQQMAETQTSITPTGSLNVVASTSSPGNYTVSIIGLSDEVQYEDFYITISGDFGTVIIGDTTNGLTSDASAQTDKATSATETAIYNSAATTVLDSTTLSAGDALKLGTSLTTDPWDGAQIKYVHIPTGGLIAQKTID